VRGREVAQQQRARLVDPLQVVDHEHDLTRRRTRREQLAHRLEPRSWARWRRPGPHRRATLVQGIARDRAGRLLVGGYVEESGRSEMLLMRFDADGNPDPRLATRSSGRARPCSRCTRTPDLALDPQFDGDGRRLLSFGGAGSTLSTVAWGPHRWV
jgi:hypothetical protein